MDESILRSVPTFAALPEEELHAVATWANEASVSEGSVIVNEGDYAYTFFAILEGRAEVLRGEEKLAEFGPGDFFGEVGLLEKETRNATVRALTPMRLVTLTAWDLRRLENAAPHAMAEIHRVLEERRS
jgi:CRP-like cAMP-binding protein